MYDLIYSLCFSFPSYSKKLSTEFISDESPAEVRRRQRQALAKEKPKPSDSRAPGQPFIGVPSSTLRPNIFVDETILETAEAFGEQEAKKQTFKKETTKAAPQADRFIPRPPEEAPPQGQKRSLKSIDDLKRPHVNLMGVIPPRATSAVSDLNVVMVGEPALRGDRDDDDDDAEDDFDPALFRSLYDARRSYGVTPFSGSGRSPKPAILAQTGTQQKLTFSQRPTPANKG